MSTVFKSLGYSSHHWKGPSPLGLITDPGKEAQTLIRTRGHLPRGERHAHGGLVEADVKWQLQNPENTALLSRPPTLLVKRVKSGSLWWNETGIEPRNILKIRLPPLKQPYFNTCTFVSRWLNTHNMLIQTNIVDDQNKMHPSQSTFPRLTLATLGTRNGFIDKLCKSQRMVFRASHLFQLACFRYLANKDQWHYTNS